LDRTVRRRTAPRLSAWPCSTGPATSRPYWPRRISPSTFFGFWNGMRGMGPPVSSLLAVQLDDELLAHGDLDVVAERQAAHGPLLLVGVDLQPLGHLAAARVQVVVQARHELRGRPKLDHIPHLHQVRRHRDLPAV